MLASLNDMGILSCPGRQFITAVHTFPHLFFHIPLTHIQIIMRGHMEVEGRAWEGVRGLCPVSLQDLPCFRGVGLAKVEQGYQWRHWKWDRTWPSSPRLSCWLKKDRESTSLRSGELRRWIIPGAFPVPIEEGAPLDLSVVAAAVSGQNGPQWTWHLIPLLSLSLPLSCPFISLFLR